MSSVGVTAEFRSVTSMLPAPVLASAAIRGSFPVKSMSRPRSAPACSSEISHERLDELSELDLARYRLRSLDHRPDVQLFDRRARPSHSAQTAPTSSRNQGWRWSSCRTLPSAPQRR